MAKKVQSYHFDLGNSSTGPIGMCAVVQAKSKAEALKILRDCLPSEIDITSFCLPSDGAIDYVQIYLGSNNIKIADVTVDAS